MKVLTALGTPAMVVGFKGAERIILRGFRRGRSKKLRPWWNASSYSSPILRPVAFRRAI